MSVDNVSTNKILHDTAMDFFDLAKIAKAKGNDVAFHELMTKALAIEKEVALKIPDNSEGFFWPFAYLRSAAWMAFYLKRYDDAELLVQLALAGKPSEFEIERLMEVFKALEKEHKGGRKTALTDDSNNLTGFLVSVDLSQRIVVVQINNSDYKSLTIPQKVYLAPYLLGHLVTISIDRNAADQLVIQSIRLAA